MIKPKEILIDFLIAMLAYLVPLTIRLLPYSQDYLWRVGSIIVAAFIMLLMLRMFGVYRQIWENTSGYNINVIVKAVVIATLIIAVVNLPYDNRPIPLSVVFVGGMLALGGFVGIRYRSRFTTNRALLAQGSTVPPTSVTHVLIVGAGKVGQGLAVQLKYQSHDTRYEIVGFVDDAPNKQQMYVEGSKVLGTRSDIPTLVNAHHIDLIAIAILNLTGIEFRNILSYCEQTNARIKVLPDVLALMNSSTNPLLLRDIQLSDLIGRNDIGRHAGIDLGLVQGKTILVTGAAGSIGSELSRQLVTYEPTTLYLLDSNESDLHDLHTGIEAQSPQLKIVPILADITQRDGLETLFKQYAIQVVFHAAAYKHVPMLELYPEQSIRVNVVGTQNLIELASQYGVERFVLISTDKAISPISVMGASKRICELLVHKGSQRTGNRTLYTAVRFGNVIGSRGSVVPMFTRQIDAGGPVTITDPQMTRYFMTIPEAVNLVIHAACLTQGDDVFVLKMGEVIRIVDLAERMIRLRGLRPGIDIKIAYTGIRPGEKLHEELFEPGDNPVTTAHPYIMKINVWDGLWNAEEFEQRLNNLIQTADRVAIRDQIFQLTAWGTVEKP